MYKVIFILKKYYILTYFVLCEIYGSVLDFMFHNHTISILLGPLVSVITVNTIYIKCDYYPLKRYQRTCKLDLLKSDIEYARKKITSKNKQEILEKLDTYYNYFAFGPTSEIIDTLQKKAPSYSPKFYDILFLSLIEKKDKSTIRKVKENLAHEIRSNKIYYKLGKIVMKDNILINKMLSKIIRKYDTLYLLDSMILENEKSCEKKLLNNINLKIYRNKLDLAVIYYFLSIYYNQNGDYISEKDALNKVVVYGDENYMAKMARKRLKDDCKL